jgi:hypothetical protein
MKLFPGFRKICEESETEISVRNRSTLGDKQEFLLDAPETSILAGIRFLLRVRARSR